MIYEQEYKTKEKREHGDSREYKGYKANIENILTKTLLFPCRLFFLSMS